MFKIAQKRNTDPDRWLYWVVQIIYRCTDIISAGAADPKTYHYRFSFFMAAQVRAIYFHLPVHCLHLNPRRQFSDAFVYSCFSYPGYGKEVSPADGWSVALSINGLTRQRDQLLSYPAPDFPVGQPAHIWKLKQNLSFQFEPIFSFITYFRTSRHHI